MKRGLILGAAAAGVAAIAVAIVLGKRGAVEPPMTPGAVLTVPNAEPRILVAHRSMLGERAEIELVRARDGVAIWKMPMPTLGADVNAIAVDAGGIVVTTGSGKKIVGLDPERGTVRWETALEDDAEHMWIRAGVLVVSPLSTSEASISAFDLATGRKLWRSPPVSSQYAPALTNDHLVIPTRHAQNPPLRIIALRSGAVATVGSGLVWPGIATDGAYTTLFEPGLGGAALVTAPILAFGLPDAGAASAEPPALGDGSSRQALVTIDLANGAMKRNADLPADAERGEFFTRWKDHAFFATDKGASLVSPPTSGDGKGRMLAAPAGYRFWSGGAANAEWRHREAWPFLEARTRFVPMVLNALKGDAAKICLIDLDAFAFGWCADRDLPAKGGPWGWLSATSRGTLHFFEIDDAILVLDGTTGKARSAFTLRSADGTITGWPSTLDEAALAGDVLAGRREAHAWAVDVANGTLAWQRGLSAITVRDARTTVTAALGTVPF